MINEVVAVKTLNAGLVGALVAGVALDANLVTVLIVGIVGGLAYTAKEFVVEHFKGSPWKYTAKMITTALMSMALVGFVFYLGRDGFNAHVKDIGNPVWIFLAFMAGLNQKTVLDFLAPIAVGAREMALGAMDMALGYIRKKFGGKNG